MSASDTLWDEVYAARTELIHAALVCAGDDMVKLPEGEHEADMAVVQALVYDDELFKATLKLAHVLCHIVESSVNGDN